MNDCYWRFGYFKDGEMDDLRVSRSARGYRHPSSVNDVEQSVMCWRGLVVLVLWVLFLSECLEQARWTVKEGAHDNDIIILKALIVPNTARKREKQQQKWKGGRELPLNASAYMAVLEFSMVFIYKLSKKETSSYIQLLLFPANFLAQISSDEFINWCINFDRLEWWTEM